MRLINAEKLMRELHEHYAENNAEQNQIMDEVCMIVHYQPIENNHDSMHGAWMPPAIGKYGCVCDVCRCQADARTDYCPNCGARMDKKSELKPCPFCGDHAVVGSEWSQVENDFEWQVCCSNPECYAEIGWMPTKEDAIKAWNRREQGAE